MQIPGTKLRADETPPRIFDTIFPAIEIHGLMLSQVCDITGLEASTIQNWVKRGWVAKPTGKRYGRLQLARILIINLLKDALRLERIALLLQAINGSADCREDDMIDDCELYEALSRIVFAFMEQKQFNETLLGQWVNDALSSYKPRWDGARETLEAALTAMAYAYLSSWMKEQSQSHLHVVLNGGEPDD